MSPERAFLPARPSKASAIFSGCCLGCFIYFFTLDDFSWGWYFYSRSDCCGREGNCSTLRRECCDMQLEDFYFSDFTESFPISFGLLCKICFLCAMLSRTGLCECEDVYASVQWLIRNGGQKCSFQLLLPWCQRASSMAITSSKSQTTVSRKNRLS